jgi:hypothetical protein
MPNTNDVRKEDPERYVYVLQNGFLRSYEVFKKLFHPLEFNNEMLTQMKNSKKLSLNLILKQKKKSVKLPKILTATFCS